MKTITIKQPWAHLICEGIKDIENRTWPTKFKGRILIHASAKPIKMINPNNVFSNQQWESLSTDQKLYIIAGKISNSAIIGSVEIVDCVINHRSIWAEKTEVVNHPDPELSFLPAYGDKLYNWVLANPILFPEPIPAKGKLSFWDYPNILAEPEEKDGELFCHCQLPVKEENQVTGYSDDYRCNYCGGKWYK